jgi:choline dehydrogenase-like flavoprotein
MVDRTPAADADVCVVGAGVAGGLVAYSLASAGYDVVILEAGPRFDRDDISARLEMALRPEHDLADVWDMGGERDRYTKSLPNNITSNLNFQRVKGVGGTTLHWDAGTLRLHEKDFNMQSRYGLAADWPIDYTDLRPYYAAAEQELGVAGGGDNPFVPREEEPPMPAHPKSYTDTLFEAACDELGIATHSFPLAINSKRYSNRAQCVGFNTCNPICPSGAKYSGDVHIRKAEAEGARVIDRAPVQSIKHNSDGEIIVAAEYATPSGEVYRQEARQFVVACGGIETPRLLLLSRSDQHPDGLANRSGVVGKYLFSDSSVSVTAELDGTANTYPIGYTTMYSDEFYDHEEPRPGTIQLRFDNVDPQSPVETALRGGFDAREQIYTEPISGIKWGDDLLDEVDHATDNRVVRITAVVETIPRSESAVTLDGSETDDHGNPVPHVEFDIGQHVVETGEHAIEIMKEILSEMDATITSVSDPSRQRLANHHNGTTRMGSDPEQSVVNGRLRTHDLRNLWIVSSSVFPTSGATPPTLTIAALALKTADHIDEELRG